MLSVNGAPKQKLSFPLMTSNHHIIPLSRWFKEHIYLFLSFLKKEKEIRFNILNRAHIRDIFIQNAKYQKSFN